MIPRPAVIDQVQHTLDLHPIAALLGPRQCGKTTVARMIAEQRSSTYFDLEDPADARRLSAPMTVLQALSGLVIIDEVQRRPDLFELLRVLVDRPQNLAQFLLLGSASPQLVRGVSESLAGRIGFVDLSGFDLTEVGPLERDRLWLRGGFPRSFLANSDSDSVAWRQDFIRTFLERDIPQLGITIPAETLRRFWTMVAHYHGQVWNSSEFARSFGVADTTIRGYLDRLTSALVVRQLLPWHENISKRQIKSPKVYIADSGLLHSLLNIRSISDLESHPKAGASWEGFLLDQIIRHLHADREECFFWATHGGAELDLLVVRGSLRLGFEFKRTSAPHITPSMRQSMKDLGLHRLDVIHAGSQTFPISENVRAVALSRMLDDIKPLSSA